MSNYKPNVLEHLIEGLLHIKSQRGLKIVYQVNCHTCLLFLSETSEFPPYSSLNAFSDALLTSSDVAQ